MLFLAVGSEERINPISLEAPVANWERMPVKVEFNGRQLIGEREARRWGVAPLSKLIKYQIEAKQDLK